MKTMRISLYIISLLTCFLGFTQEQRTDSTTNKHNYGLRVGTDISKLIKTSLSDMYTGFEINADFRFTKKYYIAGELGFEKHIIDETQINLTTQGSYIKLGVDYNAYENWLNMENLIFAGLRYGLSTFTQDLNSYSIYNTDTYWNENNFIDTPIEFTGSNAHWVELIVGIKAEIFSNFYLGVNAQLKNLIVSNAPDNFANLYIPGFGRTYEGSNWGAGFGYTINYLIPIFKK